MNIEKIKQLKKSYCIIIVLLTIPLCYLSFYLPPYIVPIVCVLPSYPIMVMRLLNKDRFGAIAYMLLWTFILGVSMTLLIYKMPDVAKLHILNGEKYKSEMIEWVLTGIGKESNPYQFIPHHIFELNIFMFFSLISASGISIILGAFLMNYMAYYVANLSITGKSLWLLILGWHPWSILRILAYIILGVMLSEPLLSKIMHYEYNFKITKKYITIAFIFWLSDLTIKILLAPTWQKILKSFIEWTL